MDYEYFKKNYKLIAIDLSKQIGLENPDLNNKLILLEDLKKIMQQCSLLLRKKEESTFNFSQNSAVVVDMNKNGNSRIINLLNDSDNESSRFATRKWFVVNDENDGQYGRGNENDAAIKFDTKVIKPNLCDYSDAYILVTGDIKVAGVASNTNVAFKGCVTHINDEHVETAENLDIIMPIYDLIEYSNNYGDSTGSLYQFKRDESPLNDAGNPKNFALDNSTSFKYKASLLGKTTDADGNDRSLKNTKNICFTEIFI